MAWNAQKCQLKAFASELAGHALSSSPATWLAPWGKEKATHSLVHPLGCRVQQTSNRTQMLNLIFHFLAPLTQNSIRKQPAHQYLYRKNLNKCSLLRPQRILSRKIQAKGNTCQEEMLNLWSREYVVIPGTQNRFRNCCFLPWKWKIFLRVSGTIHIWSLGPGETSPQLYFLAFCQCYTF